MGDWAGLNKKDPIRKREITGAGWNQGKILLER